VDGGISDMLSGILSNPDAMNKIMTLMPAVAQMMNGGGSNSINQQKLIETTSVNVPKADISAENLMANADVMTALKNLITAINNNGGDIKSDAVPVMADVVADNDDNENNNSGDNNINNADNKIEKTLDTLKNFSSATNPENDRKSKLLLALKPFLKEGRQTKIDTAIKSMNAAKIINMFGKNGFIN
jgi:hypothetical protein